MNFYITIDITKLRNKAHTQHPKKYGYRGNKSQIYLSVFDDTLFLSVESENLTLETNGKWERVKIGGDSLIRSIIKAVTRARNHPNRGIVEQAKANPPRVSWIS
ncbi:MAG: hypothetical protein ACFBSE_11345 [Prochloraceae cyanobacterium]